VSCGGQNKGDMAAGLPVMRRPTGGGGGSGQEVWAAHL
jgi:hypothetical protein